MGWEQPGSGGGGSWGGRQSQRTETGSRRGLPRFWSGGGKRQESDLQNDQEQHKNKEPPGIFLSPGAREDQLTQKNREMKKGEKKDCQLKYYKEQSEL